MDTLLDKLFGKKEDIIDLIKNQEWDRASNYADHICVELAKDNKDWTWGQLIGDEIYTPEKVSMWNSTSYGNAAYMIRYAEKNNIREEERNYVKTKLLEVVNR